MLFRSIFPPLVPKEEEPPKVKEEEKSAKKLAVKTPNPKTKGGKTSAVRSALYLSIDLSTDRPLPPCLPHKIDISFE